MDDPSCSMGQVSNLPHTLGDFGGVMKIEIGESLAYSFLRHVKQCWLVQTNWKVSEHWAKRQPDEALEAMFSAMRKNFDPDGSVFKGTKDCSQFLRQGEIDVVGVGQDGCVHAMEVAFHEAGLNYGSTAETSERVLKKLLRTMLILNAYHSEETEPHIYFVSPKVHRGVQQPLEEIFSRLRAEYSSIDWHLLTNDEFTNQLLVPTLERAGSVADTSELFVRSAKLLELAGLTLPLSEGSQHWQRLSTEYGIPPRTGGEATSSEPGQLQPLVRGLMTALLEDYPDLLSENDRMDLMDVGYCESRLGLQLDGYPLLRRKEQGRMDGGHYRYWAKVYGGRYYVTNNWWKQHHPHNAGALMRWAKELIDRREGHPGIAALQRHRDALRAYLQTDDQPPNLFRQPEAQGPDPVYTPETPMPEPTRRELGQLQPLVRNLMQTLLEDYPDLLSESELQDLLNPVFCRVRLGLEMNDSDVALIRRREEGIIVNGLPKYWVKVYGGRYYVSKEWWPQHRTQNGPALLRWVGELIARNYSHPRVRELEWHRAAFQNYLGYQ